MQLRELGEFALIERIERAARRQGRPRAVVVGIGDDAAVLRPPAGEDVVVTTDALVEGVHFRFDTQSHRCIGRRALVANLSDLAAMGARPLGFVVALSAPPSLEVRVVDGLLHGLLSEARAHRCPLVGGNLTRARQTALTISALGSVPRGRQLLRSAARPGDRICVTGTLGGSALELARAEAGQGRVRRVPSPRLGAGRALARQTGIGACIDVSDGLSADLGHLLDSSGCSAEIDRASLPLPPRFAAACRRLQLDPIELATGGGEDYELLFTVRRTGPSGAQLRRRLGVAVTEIGRVVERRARTGNRSGWSHF